jgi:hypothetical protein
MYSSSSESNIVCGGYFCDRIYYTKEHPCYDDYHISCTVKEGVEMSAELNMENRTLHFFINGKIVQNYVSGIPSLPMHMGV